MSASRSSGGVPWRGLVWFVAGLVVAYLLLADPLGLGLLPSQRPGPGETASAKASDSTVWICPMHPDLLHDRPGECPICGMDLVPLDERPTDAAAIEDDGEILFYRHPMDPEVTSPVPAEDEMGMPYVPVYAEEAPSGAAPMVEIDPVVVQNMNVQSAPVVRRDLRHRIRSVGYLEYDQERMVSVTTKYSGWVERVYANYVGERIEKGQPLFEIYSPELVQTEQELLSALEYAARLEEAPREARRRADALVDAARTRLSYWDISPQQIAELEASGEIFRTLRVVAPASGVIMKRIDGLEGMAVRPGMEIFHIADLSTLWLSVEIFEDQVAWIDVGTPAEIEFTYFPGETFRGVVRFVEPEFSERTRTLRVKIEVPNPRGRLKAGMFATVVFEPVAVHEALAVPSLAVLRTGRRNVVVLDLGSGRFAPREVTLGHQGEGFVEVLDGLVEGDRVVTSAQFLLDSEASLQEAIQKMLADRSGGGVG